MCNITAKTFWIQLVKFMIAFTHLFDQSKSLLKTLSKFETLLKQIE
jgi:hypothetical protein